MPTKKTTVERVVGELETRGDIAHRLGIAPGTVDQWIHRHSGKGFPDPIGTLAGMSIYWQPEVDRWLTSTGRS